ncbi:hypothetical protein [Actinoplanes sp. RD1]|uniref:hypothetical protein n=1 Tax=Actinoplanes sp. RD1 TaxID=3064538 RepID=UPI0027408970|nr:hypothetical protein [Actinoplanes sp. RD1]
MPTLPDPAQVNLPGRTTWRTCGTCGLNAALAPGVDTCQSCAHPTTMDTQRALTGWPLAHLYAETVGRVRAWADMAGVTDAERLDRIRQALVHLDRFHPARAPQKHREAGECH